MPLRRFTLVYIYIFYVADITAINFMTALAENPNSKVFFFLNLKNHHRKKASLCLNIDRFYFFLKCFNIEVKIEARKKFSEI